MRRHNLPIQCYICAHRVTFSKETLLREIAKNQNNNETKWVLLKTFDILLIASVIHSVFVCCFYCAICGPQLLVAVVVRVRVKCLFRASCAAFIIIGSDSDVNRNVFSRGRVIFTWAVSKYVANISVNAEKETSPHGSSAGWCERFELAACSVGNWLGGEVDENMWTQLGSKATS